MKILFVHPGPLLSTYVFLRLEPLGLELVVEAARRAGHSVRLVDLQVESHSDYHRMMAEWRPDLIAFSCNYLANVPEVVDLAKATKLALPRSFICVGGHSASFTARAPSIACSRARANRPSSSSLKPSWATAARSLKCPAPSPRTARVLGRDSSSTSTKSGPRAISCATAANISSACSTPAPRSNSRAGAHGTVLSAAPGRSMAAATGRSARNGCSRI